MKPGPLRPTTVAGKLLAPLLAILFLILGNGFFLSFVSLKLNELNFDGWLIGGIHSAYYLGMLIGAARAEVVINRVGHIRAYAGYAGLGTACLMVQGLTLWAPVWVLMRFITGFCIAVYYIVVESWLLGAATAKNRGVILAVYMTVLYFSQGVSQFFLNALNLEGPEPFYVAGLLSALSAVPLALTKAPSPDIENPSGHSLSSLWRESHFGFMGCFVGGLVLSAIYTFLPLFAEAQGLSVAAIMATCIFGGVVLQWPLGKLSDHWDRRQVLFLVALGCAIHPLLIFFVPLSEALSYLWIFILGGLAFTLYPLSIAQVCDRLQPSDLTKATGMLLLVYGLGAVAGPVATPLFFGVSEINGLFAFLSVSSLLAVGMGLISFARSPAVPEELQGDFVALPRVSPVAYELDPRIDETD